jgi:hypothetical protein
MTIFHNYNPVSHLVIKSSIFRETKHMLRHYVYKSIDAWKGSLVFGKF